MVYLGKRQQYTSDNGYDDDTGNWWYSDTAEAIKWAVVAGIFLAIILYFIGGYLHAKRRVARGQPPLAYHRWLLPRSQRMRQAPAQQFTFYSHQQNPYEMNAYPPPPPAYNRDDVPPPPMYEPPPGASKTNPDQQFAPPSGPPPTGEASNAGPSHPAQERTHSPREQYHISTPQNDETQLPPRPLSSSRSWNPLKRFK